MSRRLAAVVAFCLLCVAVMLAADVSLPDRIPNPNIANRYDYVSDPAHLLDSRATEMVNSELQQLRKQTTAEAAVAIVPSIGDMPIEEFATALFAHWGLGKADRDNGVLLVIAIEQKRARIEVGYGAEGALPDISCKRIIDYDIIPAMKQGDLNTAVTRAVSSICGALSDPAVAEELRSSAADNVSGQPVSPISGEVVWKFIQIIATCVFFFTLILFCTDLYRMKGKDNFRRAMTWRSRRSTYIWTLPFSILTTAPIVLLAIWLASYYRNRPRKCPTCGGKMHKLSESEDNELLDSGQDLEERLNTVDYDVWKCDKCGTVERFPFRQKQTRYTECPRCHTIAMTLKSDRIVAQPTTRQPGQGVRTYECLHCGYHHDTPYRIERKESGAEAALAAAAILGSMSRGGGGGGGFGGGFGGGSSGGGGASGGW